MNNVWITTWYTIREALARKVFLFFLGLSALAIIISGIVVNVISDASLMSGFDFKQGGIVVKEVSTSIKLVIITPLTSLCILLAVFSTASFVPIMLEKGNIDLLLSKPISRTQLLIGKYFGGLLVVFINIAFLVIGVWVVVSLRFMYFDFAFLSIILSVTFTFAVLYSLIVLFGVITQGSILGMMLAYFIFLILSPVLYMGITHFNTVIKSDFLNSLIETLYYITPKTHELMGETTINLAIGKGIADWQPILTSLAFMLLALGYSIYLFNKKDF